MRSIDQAIALGFENVKINCVLLKNINDDEFFDFVKYVKSRSVTVRFIELMRTGDNAEYFKQHHLPISVFQEVLIANGWRLTSSNITSGPAKEYSHQQSIGRIGFISPYSKDFCSNCNRLRISAVGGLRLCLFGEGDVSLRDLLQKVEDRPRLEQRIGLSLGLKLPGHRLHENIYGNMHSLSTIGG